MYTRLLDHFYILSTIFFTVYSQLIMRWQVGLADPLPIEFTGKILFIGRLLINPWVISGILATFLAGVSWMLTMGKFQISYAYPFVSLNYVLIMIASFLIFHEDLSLAKLIGTLVVIAGIIIIARG